MVRLVTVIDDFQQELIEQMIRGNRRIKQKNITLKLEAYEERVGHIVNPLGFRKVCTRWVPRKLTGEINADRVRILRGILGCFEVGNFYIG
jgi:hypothetical protein